MLQTGEFQERARALGAHLEQALQPLIGHGVTAVRIAGLWAGVDIDPATFRAAGSPEKLLDRGCARQGHARSDGAHRAAPRHSRDRARTGRWSSSSSSSARSTRRQAGVTGSATAGGRPSLGETAAVTLPSSERSGRRGIRVERLQRVFLGRVCPASSWSSVPSSPPRAERWPWPASPWMAPPVDSPRDAVALDRAAGAVALTGILIGDADAGERPRPGPAGGVCVPCCRPCPDGTYVGVHSVEGVDKPRKRGSALEVVPLRRADGRW